MIDLLLYLPVCILNIIFMVLIIRKRGILSFEGLGLTLLSVVVISDVVGLTVYYFFIADNIDLDLQPRFYASIVHIVGIISFGIGLFSTDPNPAPLPRVFTKEQKRLVNQAAYFFIVFGLGLKFTTLYVEGISSIQDYFLKMSGYIVAQRQLGGFFDQGLDIAILGSLIIAANKRKAKYQALWVLAGALLTLGLSLSKSGIIIVIITFGFLLWIFNKRMIRFWLKPVFVVPALILILASAGIKAQFRSGPQAIDTSSDTLFFRSIEVFKDRFSNVGLYDGYANFIWRLSEQYSYYNGEVMHYTLTSWVPYVLYENKPQHPFRAIGDLVYNDYRVSYEDVSAVMLVGTAFADFGLWSVVIYLLIYGMFLGFIRNLTTGSVSSIIFFMWYLHFIFIDGYTNFIHGGIVNIFGTIALAVGVVGATFVYLHVYQIVRTAAGPSHFPSQYHA